MIDETAQQRARRLWDSVKDKPAALPVEFIRPVKLDLRIETSFFDEDTEQCFAVVVSDGKTAFLDREVIEYVTYHSGLSGWKVVAGYPFLDYSNNRIEWRLRIF